MLVVTFFLSIFFWFFSINIATSMNVNFPTSMIVNVTLVIKKDFFPRINKNQ